MQPSTRILAATVFAASSLLVCLASAALGRPTVRVTVKWPFLPRTGKAIDLWGRAANTPSGSRAVLEQRRSASGHWSVSAVSRIREGQFELWWQPRASGNATVRVAIVHDRNVLASNARHVAVTPPATPLPRAVPPIHEVHPAPETRPAPETHPPPDLSGRQTEGEVVPDYCAEPSPPINVPAGDGWIVGGLYLSGGPYPGIFACQDASYEVTVTNEEGTVVATQQVTSGGQGYTFILPPGRYTLTADGPTATSAVTAGAQTKTNIISPIP
jgi:hypothetical protein